MGKAKFKLSTYRLEQLLGLPYNARIVCVERFYNDWNIICEITVEHPDLPNDIEIFPTWNDITRREFVDWGIPK